MRTKQQSNPILKGSLPTFLRTFFGIVIVIFFNISITHGETIIGFNWGDGEAVKKALESAAQDSELYKPGFKAGPRFWKSLIAAQSDADHGAGDGFYFSINPWDSARFGPSLLIVELHFPSDQKSKLVLSTTAEYGASTPPSQLPPVLRYKGSWHVVKALPPKTSELTVYIREASGADAQMIFDHFNLKNNFVGSIEFIQGLMQRENALFGLEGRRSIKGERQGRLKKENKATKKYLNNLMALLFDEGLKVDSKKILTEVEKSRRSQSLDAVLRQLENPEQWHHVFGLNLENFLYGRLLENFEALDVDMKLLLFNRNADLALRWGPKHFIAEMMSYFESTQNLHGHLSLRATLSKLNLKNKLPERSTLEVVLRTTELPREALNANQVSYFNMKLFASVPESKLQNYLDWLTRAPVDSEEHKSLLALQKRFTQNSNSFLVASPDLTMSCRKLLQ